MKQKLSDSVEIAKNLGTYFLFMFILYRIHHLSLVHIYVSFTGQHPADHFQHDFRKNGHIIGRRQSGQQRFVTRR